MIAQVKRLAQGGSLPPRSVKVPAPLTDAVVVHPDQWQTVAGPYNPSFSGELRTPRDQLAPLDFGLRKMVARRAAQEIRPDTVVNLGFGIADGVANVAAEEGRIDDVTFSVEQGLVGGISAKGDIFGAAYNPEAIVDATHQFDFYHGGGLDLTFLGMAQVDRHGNVNVSKFGGQLPGCGGSSTSPRTPRRSSSAGPSRRAASRWRPRRENCGSRPRGTFRSSSRTSSTGPSAAATPGSRASGSCTSPSGRSSD